MMLGWGMRNPDTVQAFVGIYPVCNLATWGMKNLPVTLADYQLTEGELQTRLAEFNPLDNLKSLAGKKVPMFVVQGDTDKAVPGEENAMLLKARYEALGAPITVRIIPGEGHQVSPSFFENEELIAFMLELAGGRGRGQMENGKRQIANGPAVREQMANGDMVGRSGASRRGAFPVSNLGIEREVERPK